MVRFDTLIFETQKLLLLLLYCTTLLIKYLYHPFLKISI